MELTRSGHINEDNIGVSLLPLNVNVGYGIDEDGETNYGIVEKLEYIPDKKYL